MPQILSKSMYEALDWIASQLGFWDCTWPCPWKYGDLHRNQFGHPLGGLLGYLNYPPDIAPFVSEPVPMDGGSYTVYPGGWMYNTTKSQLGLTLLLSGGGVGFPSSACYRGIYECKASWDTSLIVVPPGESANATGGLLSPVFDVHYGDQYGMWLGNTYYWRPLLFAGVPGMGFPSTTLHPDVTPPVADAGPDQTVERNTVVNFDGTGSYDNVGIVAWEWDFGDAYDPTKAYTAVATHTFVHPVPTDGVYTVTLTVWDAEDLSDSDTCTINVYIAVGGEAEVIGPPPTIPLSLLIGLFLVTLSLVAAVAFSRLKKKRQ
jgi:hypothetical protein